MSGWPFSFVTFSWPDKRKRLAVQAKSAGWDEESVAGASSSAPSPENKLFTFVWLISSCIERRSSRKVPVHLFKRGCYALHK